MCRVKERGDQDEPSGPGVVGRGDYGRRWGEVCVGLRYKVKGFFSFCPFFLPSVSSCLSILPFCFYLPPSFLTPSLPLSFFLFFSLRHLVIQSAFIKPSLYAMHCPSHCSGFIIKQAHCREPSAMRGKRPFPRPQSPVSLTRTQLVRPETA